MLFKKVLSVLGSLGLFMSLVTPAVVLTREVDLYGSHIPVPASVTYLGAYPMATLILLFLGVFVILSAFKLRFKYFNYGLIAMILVYLSTYFNSFSLYVLELELKDERLEDIFGIQNMSFESLLFFISAVLLYIIAYVGGPNVQNKNQKGKENEGNR